MPQIRPTIELWRKLQGRGELLALDSSDDECSRLGHWTAKPLRRTRGRLFLAFNEKTALCLVLKLELLDRLLESFKRELSRELERLGVPEDDIAAEVQALSDVEFAKNQNRSAMGSLNDLARLFDYEIDRYGGLSPRTIPLIQQQLNRVPHVNRDPSFAEDAIRQLFGLKPRGSIPWQRP